jgi:hypothetical protein
VLKEDSLEVFSFSLVMVFSAKAVCVKLHLQAQGMNNIKTVRYLGKIQNIVVLLYDRATNFGPVFDCFLPMYQNKVAQSS